MPRFEDNERGGPCSPSDWVVFDWWAEFVLWREWRKGVVKLELLKPEWQNRIRYLDERLAAIRAKHGQKSTLA